MKEQRFTMFNLISRLIYGNIKDLMDLVANVELISYEEGRFQNGPTMVEFCPTETGSSDQQFRLYIPVNELVEAESDDGFAWDWIPELDIPKVLRTRIPFDDGVERKLEEMKHYLQENDKKYEDRLILLFSKIYDEYWVDMVIPYV